MRKKAAGCLADAGKAVVLGLAAAGGILAVFFLIGLLLNAFQIKAALLLARGGLFFVGAFALFILAGLLLKKDGGRRVQSSDRWRRHFQVLGLTPVVMIVAVMILAAAMALDYGLWGMK